MSLPVANSMVSAIRRKVRQLTNSPDSNSLTDSDIDETINDIYNTDFPYAIKIDQMRSVYTIYTQPYIDRYPLDVNYNQGVRAPVYIDGVQGAFFKDRQQFYNLWPRLSTQFQQGGTTLTGDITGIAQPSNPTQITSVNHNLITGAIITISDVGGMTQLNGNNYQITVIDANTFSLNGIDNTAYGAYTGGGTWTATDQSFSFQIQGPFLSNEVMIGGISTVGSAINIRDDGQGNLQYMIVNSQTSIPAQNTNPAKPGMYNTNTGNPGLINPINIGSVDYISGQFDFTLPAGVSLASGEIFTVRVSQYQPGVPYSILFWNNEFQIRPIPSKIHKIDLEVFLTPVQFMNSTDVPILTQWWKYIAYLVACEVQRNRNDFDSVAQLQEGANRQESLVLERQSVEEIGQPNFTIFNSTVPNTYLNNFWGMGI